jgi:hypothetical protein
MRAANSFSMPVTVVLKAWAIVDRFTEMKGVVY